MEELEHLERIVQEHRRGIEQRSPIRYRRESGDESSLFDHALDWMAYELERRLTRVSPQEAALWQRRLIA